MCFQNYGSKWHKLQVDGLKNILLKFMDLNSTPLQVVGPLVYFTLKEIRHKVGSMLPNRH